jgi:hypothetical protein
MNPKNRSTGSPILFTYFMTNDNWSTFDISGVESTLIEKYVENFNSSSK